MKRFKVCFEVDAPDDMHGTDVASLMDALIDKGLSVIEPDDDTEEYADAHKLNIGSCEAT